MNKQTDTEFIALLKSMFSGGNTSSRAPANKKTSTPTPPRPEPGDWKFRPGWTDQAVVLLQVESTCTCCQRRHVAPSPYLFLRRYHPKLGVYEEALTTHSPKHMELPRRVEVHSIEVSHCAECFVPRDYSRRQFTFDFHADTAAVAVGGTLDGLIAAFASESCGATSARGDDHQGAPRHALRPSVPLHLKLIRDDAKFPIRLSDLNRE